MAKKKNITSSNMISYYMDYVLEHGEQPKTVYAFAKHHNFEESKFYEFYGSFEALEKHIFQVFFTNSIDALEKNDDYKNFDARNQLLSVYFTFFENLTANRSYVLYALKQHKNKLKGLQALSELKKTFTSYIEQLDISLIETKQERIDKIQRRALKESAWGQLLLTIKFWMDDTSPAFEKTDIFIEKCVNTSFDILDIAPMKSLIDLGKFIYKEKIHSFQ
ncbi:MAG: TetR/AcrR family transcriptional regulator [Algicola sp.]|nr:TetR/AcrR family transcriptional regulator [Algicola sp.]